MSPRYNNENNIDHNSNLYFSHITTLYWEGELMTTLEISGEAPAPIVGKTADPLFTNQ